MPYDIGDPKGEEGVWDGVYQEWPEHGVAAVRAETGSSMMAFARMEGQGAMPKELRGMYTELKFATEAMGRYEARLKAEVAGQRPTPPKLKQPRVTAEKAIVKPTEDAFQGA